MNRAWMILALLIVIPAPARADDANAPASQSDGSLAALKKAYKDAEQSYSDDVESATRGAKNQEEIEKALEAHKLKVPAYPGEFSPRFLAVAAKDPQGPEALEALRLALRIGPDRSGKAIDTRVTALRLLRVHYTTSPDLDRDLLSLIARYKEREARAFLDDVVDRNPDRRIQALALRARADYYTWSVRVANDLETNGDLRKDIEIALGKEVVAEKVTEGKSNRGKAEPILATLRERYADVLPPVAIGDPAPPLVGQTLDGKTARLADLRGKVVVLDVWATTCGPCKEMIPHEREMVARLKGKPFELISISGDEKKETLKGFLAKVPMPWTHWWDGPEGKLQEQLDVQGWPSTFVLDHTGVIRFIGVRGEEMEEAVNALLKEAEAKSAG
ncbi:TlpA family protein disulfide reductase [Aquisphaera insulae]|uniref:TlpA family protein disulfide reductase n=1 Tax=Aquisphaera insulae TaxID=2712864 RepID=UPI0013EC715A|nr:TlpA disulfide reductase family protein [Aquisphaera insulae]